MDKEMQFWLVLGAAAIAVSYFVQAQPQPTPLAIYPELAYTATPQQQAALYGQPASPYFSSVQQDEQTAVYGQCAGASVCSPLVGDTQLGF